MVAFLGAGQGKLITALCVIGWVGYARVMRGQVLKVREYDYVLAARALGAIGPGIVWEKMGDGWTWTSRDLEQSADLAREGWEEVRRRIADATYDLLVLDEFTYPLTFGWVPVGEVVEALTNRPGFQHIVVTGRAAPQELIDIADLVTEMRKLKHPYDRGIKAQRGVEF